MVIKKIECLLVVNYKTSKVRVLSKKFKPKLNGFEIPVNIFLDFIVPETPVLNITGEIKLSDTQIAGMIVEQLKEDIEDDTKM